MISIAITGGIGSHGYQILEKAGIMVAMDEEGIIEDCIDDFMRRYQRRMQFENGPR